MYKSFDTLDELFKHMGEDKNWSGAEASLHNRYPIRFVLFDNFVDFKEFIENRPHGIYNQSLEKILDPESPDCFLSYTELSTFIRSFAKKMIKDDFVIFPFSEIARFYDNTVSNEFNSLITTIRQTEASEDAQDKHVRFYIPIVGMQGKMSKFMNDNISFVWEYKSNEDKGSYTLITTDGTSYGVTGLEEHYTVVKNLYEWIELWKKGEGIKKKIICQSQSIFINAKNAQPDNAFTYCECKDAFQFLTKGLQLDFGVMEEPLEEELPYWEQLAENIDINTFNFEEFVKERFDTFTLNNGNDFIKSWFECDSDFDRWLLTLYFKNIADKNSYIYKAVCQCAKLTKSELFSTIATLIFDEVNKDIYISERFKALSMAAKHDVNITDLAKQKLNAKLRAIAVSPEEGGYYKAVQLLTPFTDAERQLALQWVSQKNVSLNDIKKVFPDLYSYMQPIELNSLSADNQWIKEYIDAYRWSKISDTYSSNVADLIQEKNASPLAFQGWRDEFKTVKTLLHNRKDIDVIYWIDGLGIDWIPYIRYIVEKYSTEKIYLNEIHVGIANLPTTTSVNKPQLQSLLPDGDLLQKKGDLDSFAHSAKKYPQYIIDEIEIVKNAITNVLDEYNGKKIAFVSDHGLTYLSQFNDGMKLAGIDSDHEGRCAKITSGKFVADNNYLILDDGKTVCSLTHKSLVNKVDRGHGAHGGCSPEEVLVPIMVVSSTKNANTFNVAIESDEVSGTHPVVRLTIKGLSSVDIPYVKYNGVEYRLFTKGNDVFESERLNLVDTARRVIVYINNEPVDNFSISISTGAEEDKLFDDFF